MQFFRRYQIKKYTFLILVIFWYLQISLINTESNTANISDNRGEDTLEKVHGNNKTSNLTKYRRLNNFNKKNTTSKFKKNKGLKSIVSLKQNRINFISNQSLDNTIDLNLLNISTKPSISLNNSTQVLNYLNTESIKSINQSIFINQSNSSEHLIEYLKNSTILDDELSGIYNMSTLHTNNITRIFNNNKNRNFEINKLNNSLQTNISDSLNLNISNTFLLDSTTKKNLNDSINDFKISTSDSTTQSISSTSITSILASTFSKNIKEIKNENQVVNNGENDYNGAIVENNDNKDDDGNADIADENDNDNNENEHPHNNAENNQNNLENNIYDNNNENENNINNNQFLNDNNQNNQDLNFNPIRNEQLKQPVVPTGKILFY
jgi:hypothetical protein